MDSQVVKPVSTVRANYWEHGRNARNSGVGRKTQVADKGHKDALMFAGGDATLQGSAIVTVKTIT